MTEVKIDHARDENIPVLRYVFPYRIRDGAETNTQNKTPAHKDHPLYAVAGHEVCGR